MKHIIEDKTGHKIEIEIAPEAPASTYFSMILRIGQDRLGQCAGHGICGQCKFQLKEGGTVQVQDSLHDGLLEKGKQLACCRAPAANEDTHIIFDNFEFSRGR